MSEGSWGTFTQDEAKALDERAALAEARQERDALRREVRELRKAAAEAATEDADPFGPRSEWQERLTEARDMADQGQIRKLYEERRQHRELEAERQGAAEAERRRNEHPAVVEWDAETERMLASEDEAVKAEGERRQLERRRHVANVIAAHDNRVSDEHLFALWDAEGKKNGFFAPGMHVDNDDHVKAAKRELVELERSGDRSSATRARIVHLEQVRDARIAELMQDPTRASFAPGSQSLTPGASDPQTMQGRLEAAYERGVATGDFTAWDRLATQAELERAGIEP